MSERQATYRVGRPSEFAMQQALFDYAALRANQDAAWGMLHVIPNGQYRRGQRPEAGLSQSKGYPDVGLDVARGPYHGLRLELKIPGGRVRPEQRDWLRRLAAEGYCVATCYSATDAIELIEDYLSLEPINA